MPMTRPLIRKTLSEQIYDALVADILNGEIRPGEKLINRDLQERFQVSSTPVRDAVNRLAADGLLRNVSKTGAQTIDFDERYVEELNEFIATISCDALTLSARNGDPSSVVRELRRHQDLMERDDARSYYEHDHHYHATFFVHSMNRFLLDTYDNVELIRSFLFHSAIRSDEDRRASIAQHKEITEAYASGAWDVARRLLIEHFRYGLLRAHDYRRDEP